jgi:glycosyltransferase involved in cell wall biosynthesis
MHRLSVVIITFNEEQNIARCLDSVKAIADEIVVVDSFSSDNTPEICKSYGCRFIAREFQGYADQKQYAIDQASNNWVLLVDADEVVSDELGDEIMTLLREGTDLHPGYRVPRSLFYMGRTLKHSGVGNEYLVRLFDRQKGGVTQVPVHESIEIKGSSGTLKGKLIHYSYNSIFQHIHKTNVYTSLAAQGAVRQGKTCSKSMVFLKFPVNFFVFYMIRGGILDGYPGFMWSFMAAFSGSVKTAKTIELQENHK